MENKGVETRGLGERFRASGVKSDYKLKAYKGHNPTT